MLNLFKKETQQNVEKIPLRMSLFKTKEKYFYFINTWKNIFKEGKHKKYKVDQKRYNWQTVKYEVCGYDKVSDLTFTDHLIYCIIRGKDLNKCFKDCSLDKLRTGIYQIQSEYNVEAQFKMFGDSLTKEQIKDFQSFVKTNYNSVYFDAYEKEKTIKSSGQKLE